MRRSIYITLGSDDVPPSVRLFDYTFLGIGDMAISTSEHEKLNI